MTSAGPRKDPTTGTWSFVVDLEPVDGKRRQARRRGFRTRKDAQEALDKLRVDAREGAYVPAARSRQRFGDFVREDWLPGLRVRQSTAESYERYLRLHVLPFIGHVELRSLSGEHLNKLYARLEADGGRRDGNPGGLSARTVRYVHTIVHAALRDAIKWKRVRFNAADDADPPSSDDAKPPEMRTWTAAELARFLEETEGHRLHPIFFTLATTGMRRGEALGLRWSDVDLDAGRASIRQQVICVAHEIVVTPRTKTGRARQIELDSTTVATLRAWRKRQAEERMLLGLGRHDGLTFSKPDGQPLHPERFSRNFERQAAKAGLPRIRLHDLRHTWATLALEAGIAPKVVSERLGHSSISITLDVYSHVSPALQAGAAERVAGLIFGTPPDVTKS